MNVEMSPAFSSPRQALAFACLLLVILLLPAAMGRRLLPPREEVYSAATWNDGPYPFLHQQLYEEKGDIDIAFMGSSCIWGGIDTPYVQQKLSEKLGRKAVVVSLCWVGQGYDAFYFIARDLMRTRKVHMLVFSDNLGSDGPHSHAWRWFRYGDDGADIHRLPLKAQGTYYFASIMGMPRNLLSLVRSNMQPNLSPAFKDALDEQYHFDRNPMDALGSEALRYATFWNPYTYVDITPPAPPPLTPEDFSIYSPETKEKFQLTEKPPPLQLHFARKFAALAAANDTKLVLLSIPRFLDRGSSVVHEDIYWPDLVPDQITLLGIPFDKAFAGVPDADFPNLYYDNYHFNKNGQRYFTPLVTESLIQLYEQANR